MMALLKDGTQVGYRAHCEDCGTSVGPVRSSFMTATRDRQAHQLATAPPGSMHADGHTAGVYKTAPAWTVRAEAA